MDVRNDRNFALPGRRSAMAAIGNGAEQILSEQRRT
jgi:hypothetical protein